MLLKKIFIGSKIIKELIFKPSKPYFTIVEKVCLEQLEKKPNDCFIKWFLSNHYVNYKRFESAQALLESLKAKGPVSRIVILLLSRVYFNLQQYDKVVEVLDGYESLYESDIHNYYLGYSFSELKMFEDATRYLRVYVKHYRKDYVGFVRLGYAYYMLRKYNLSLDAYKKAEGLKPEKNEIRESIDQCIKMLKRKK